MKSPTTSGLPCVWHSIPHPRCPDDLRLPAVSTRLLRNRAPQETFATIAGIIENKPAAELTLDAVTTTLIDAEASMALRSDRVGSGLGVAGTTTQALAATTRHRGKRRGHGSYGGRKPYEIPSDLRLRCFYCTREGRKEAGCQLKQDAERL